jgi:glyoxalase family protein
MVVELIAQPAGKSGLDDRLYYAGGPVPREYAIHGFHSATLLEGVAWLETAELLTGTMGLQTAGEEGNRFRYRVPSGGTASVVDILISQEESRGRISAGSVHHIAWRTPDDQQQQAWLNDLQKSYGVSPVMDRKYFHSIYFREPGNVLFEIATDPPGFGVDEPLAELGTHLVLPPWLEPRRGELEAVLPKLRLPVAVGAGQ